MILWLCPDIFNQIFGSFLTTREFCRVDTAYCNKKERQIFLEYCRSKTFILDNFFEAENSRTTATTATAAAVASSTHSLDFLEWMMRRNVAVRHLSLRLNLCSDDHRVITLVNRISEKAPKILSQCRSISFLHSFHVPNVMPLLAMLPSLTNLVLNGQGFQITNDCNNINSVDTSILLDLAKACPKLRALTLSNFCSAASASSSSSSSSGISDGSLAIVLTSLPALESLTLSNCPDITDDAFVHPETGEVPISHQLRCLNVAGCEKLTDVTFSSLTRCPQLTYFNMSKCSKVSGYVLQSLSFTHELFSRHRYIVKPISPSLTHLDLSGCKVAIDDALFTTIVQRHGSSLAEINLADVTRISDSSLEAIALHCSMTLRYLDVTSCSGVSDIGIIALANSCSNTLKTLILTHCHQVTNDGVAYIMERCRLLQTLHVAYCFQLSKCLDSRGSSTQGDEFLVELDISNCYQVTDAMVSLILRRHCQLASLNCTDCYNLTSAAFSLHNLTTPPPSGTKAKLEPIYPLNDSVFSPHKASEKISQPMQSTPKSAVLAEDSAHPSKKNNTFDSSRSRSNDNNNNNNSYNSGTAIIVSLEDHCSLTSINLTNCYKITDEALYVLILRCTARRGQAEKSSAEPQTQATRTAEKTPETEEGSAQQQQNNDGYTGMKQLILDGCHCITDAGINAVLSSPWTSSLEVLSINGLMKISNEGLALPQNQWENYWGQREELEREVERDRIEGKCEVGVTSNFSFSSSPSRVRLPNLRVLDVQGCSQLTSQVLVPFLKRSLCPRFESLNIVRCYAASVRMLIDTVLDQFTRKVRVEGGTVEGEGGDEGRSRVIAPPSDVTIEFTTHCIRRIILQCKLVEIHHSPFCD